MCVCVFVCGGGWRVLCAKRGWRLDVNGSKLSNSLFLKSTANVSSQQEAETVDMFIYHPSNPSMR